MSMKMTAFWDISLCSVAEVYRPDDGEIHTSEASVYFNKTAQCYPISQKAIIVQF
jgi:hypothetical protein